jgi:hypothetical protein
VYKNIILESSKKRENGLFNMNIWENEQNENYLTEMDNGKQEWASKILEFYLWYPPVLCSWLQSNLLIRSIVLSSHLYLKVTSIKHSPVFKGHLFRSRCSVNRNEDIPDLFAENETMGMNFDTAPLLDKSAPQKDKSALVFF